MLDDLRGSMLDEDKTCPIDRMDVFVGLYIAVVGRPLSGKDAPGKQGLKACQFALEAMQTLRRTIPVLEGKVRIGINSGPAVGGIAGKLSLLYTYYGDAVNQASRMATTAEWGTTQVSPAAYQQLIKEMTVGQVELESRGLINIKGKGILKGVHAAMDAADEAATTRAGRVQCHHARTRDAHAVARRFSRA